MTKRTSRRNVKKAPKSVPTHLVTVKYDRNGKVTATKEDVCDCFDADCPGCHFSCERCSSPKCGIRCRVNRPFTYDSVSFDGKDEKLTIKNPLLENRIA